MKKFSLILALVLLTGFSSAAELKIGVVDNDRVFKESPMAIRIAKKGQEEFAKRIQDFQLQGKQLQDMQRDLEKSDATLSDSDRTKKESDIRALSVQVQRVNRELNEDMRAQQSEEMQKLVAAARRAIKQVADEDKLDLVLQGPDLAYYGPQLDITDKVIKLMADR